MEQDVVASVYVIAPPKLVPLATKQVYISTAEQLANAALADLIRGGSSILPYSRGIAARMRGGYAGDLQRASCKIAEIIRKVVLGAPFTRMRKG